MSPLERTLIERAGQHGENVRHIFGLAGRLAAERNKLAADPNLSDTGKRERESKFAKELVRNLVELSRPLRRSREAAAAARAALRLPEFDRTDAVGELKRQELRSYLRGLPSGERIAALDTLGDDGVLAVLDAAPALSGLPPDRHEFIKTRYLESKFGPQLRELEAVDEDNTAFEAAAVMVRRELQIGAGLTNAEFAALEKSHE